jgi:hypothetical protein
MRPSPIPLPTARTGPYASWPGPDGRSGISVGLAGPCQRAADALSMKLREGGRVVLVHVLMDALTDELPAVAERFQGARSDILAFTA